MPWSRSRAGRPEADALRLDRFLWWVRLTKTRAAAQTLATTGRLRCNGRAIDRAHHAVKIGDILTFYADDRVRIVRVESLPARRGPAPEAQACYQDLSTDPASLERAGAASARADQTAPTANVSQESATD